MKLQEDESLGEQSEDTCSTTFPAFSEKRFFETDGDDDERCSGTDQPFDSIHGCSNDDHDSPARYDGVNYRGDAGDIWRNNRACTSHAMPKFQRFRNRRRRRRRPKNSTRTLRAALRHTPAFRTSLFDPGAGLGTTEKALGAIRSSRRGCQRAHCQSFTQRGSVAPGVAPSIADRKGHATQESNSLTRNRRRSSVVMPYRGRDARVDRRSDHLGPGLASRTGTSSASEQGQR
ncbi:hypothetical protein MRX96_014084 [Rhipicephalus microplus]|uniref:Uncharacterized protein n=1 Tax=Rhipicephalus microplus TaxID=6941 RepID=A0A9J6EPT9_RHIMP|nr:hypothetical protein HPB51_017943 [Rhipicephalus microplus]